MSRWKDTLDALMHERAAALFGYAYVLTGDADTAEDLLQDALVRTFRVNRRSGTVNEAHAYVKRAISTAFIDGHRRTEARPQRHAHDAGDFAGASATTPDHAPAADAHLDLHAAILTLPPRERACVVLRYLDDMPIAAVAAELGLADGSVKRYLSDGVARLRPLVSTLDFPTDSPDTVPVRTRGGTR
ncbi:RNA polymerase sigma factor [Demequina litorisediminis]|uniref:RNA polymerase sigma24 factor n=1 Tax=Demequina litorisediminis TaxID=1849022 RepID=A0ABQ6IBW4_9MICO|nr:sigma-70 family RNA polymerase sigma factor [Demequina litorisediminis]GMA34492.1 RNA polymerase sigma24 factor [Demequina litorisediminis]